ncbi:hypothetical protein L282_0519 [Escherichia coli APEC IMT5155]|uniref:Uncharacterized protein n=1 Tax=Escherichia coli O1:K1 / APEC TaxID=405955 RepID=A0A0H2Z1Q1_ECOK1|nr:hypothetical protein APECO1_4175 [Escherichia coli APEC O1]AJB35511.1 hypothetical protein L282_0519 [Escherichia coli APEC IMT5155]
MTSVNQRIHTIDIKYAKPCVIRHFNRWYLLPTSTFINKTYSHWLPPLRSWAAKSTNHSVISTFPTRSEPGCIQQSLCAALKSLYSYSWATRFFAASIAASTPCARTSARKASVAGVSVTSSSHSLNSSRQKSLNSFSDCLSEVFSAAIFAHLASRLSIVIPAELHSRNAVSSFDSSSPNLRTRYSAFVSLTFKSLGMHLPFRKPSISISDICFISSHSATSHSDICCH